MINKNEKVINFSEFINKKPSENMTFHLENKLSVIDNIFRPGSTSFYNLITESRDYTELLSPEDRSLFEETDLGLWGEFEGVKVPLDFPIPEEEPITEAEHNGKKVNLNKPMRSSGPKKYKVYVRNPKTGKVKVVHFGDVKGGLTTKIMIHLPERVLSLDTDVIECGNLLINFQLDIGPVIYLVTNIYFQDRRFQLDIGKKWHISITDFLISELKKYI